MEAIVLKKDQQSILLQSCFIALCSLVWIPFYPVPFTLQSFAVSLISLRSSPNQAFLSVLVYLLFHTVMSPLWITGTSAGYLIGFPIAAYLTSKLVMKYSPLIASFAGQFVIYLFGYLWLVPSIGSYNAFMKGVFLFLGIDILKNLAAIYIARKV